MVNFISSGSTIYYFIGIGIRQRGIKKVCLNIDEARTERMIRVYLPCPR